MIRSRVALALALVGTLSLVVPALAGARLDPRRVGQQQDCVEFQCADGTMGWCCGTVSEQHACLCDVCAEYCF